MMLVNKNRILKLANWKNGLLLDLLAVLFFLVLNCLYLWPYFGQNDKSNIFSAPLMPMLASLISQISGWELAKTVVMSLGVFVLITPISLYFLASRLTQRRMTGFTAALIYSLPIDWLAGERIQLTFSVGDGGHIASLAIIPAIALFLLNFLRHGSFKSLALANLGMGLVALISPFGLLIGGMILIIVTFSELLQGDSRLKIFRFVFFLILSISLVAFYYHPGFVIAFSKSNQGMVIRQTLINLVPLSFVVIPVVSAFGFLLFEKKTHLQPLFIAIGLVILFSLVAFADTVSRYFPGYPSRYLPELGLAISFLMGILITALSDYLRFGGQIYKVQLSPLARSLARKSFWLVNLGLISGIIAFSLKSVWQLPEKRVLGIWDQGLNSDIAWGVKHQNIGWPVILGWLITFLTASFLVFGWLKIPRPEDNQSRKNIPEKEKTN